MCNSVIKRERYFVGPKKIYTASKKYVAVLLIKNTAFIGNFYSFKVKYADCGKIDAFLSYDYFRLIRSQTVSKD